MSQFAEAFGVPAGHALLLVRTLRRGARGKIQEWEHEEYDRAGSLVAVYESWASGLVSPAGREGGADGRGGYVKYALDGRILRRSKAAPRGRAKPETVAHRPGTTTAAPMLLALDSAHTSRSLTQVTEVAASA